MPNRWKVLFIFAAEIQNRVDTSSEDLRVRLDKRRHHVDVSDVNRNDDKRHDDARHSMAASKGERHRASASARRLSGRRRRSTRLPAKNAARRRSKAARRATLRSCRTRRSNVALPLSSSPLQVAVPYYTHWQCCRVRLSATA